MAAGMPDLALANLPLNCPRCGKTLSYIGARTPAGDAVADSEAADDLTVYLYRCIEHGPFRLSRDIPLLPGA
jgi:hypothetical protein